MGAAIALTQQEEDRLIPYIRSTSARIERDTCIFMFGLKSGLRVGEIALLTWDILLDEKNEIRKKFFSLPGRITKGGKPRKMFLNPTLEDCIRKHFAVSFTGRKDRVFIADQGLPFTENNLTVWVSRRLKRAGIACSSHSLRKKFATETLKKLQAVGGTIVDASKLLGHSNASVTYRSYIAINHQAQEEAVMSL